MPGEKRSKEAVIDRATAKNVQWGVKICDALYSTPSIAGGRVFIGGVEGRDGVFACLEAASGKILWRWKAPAREVPRTINGFSIGISEIPQQLGVCSTAAIDGDRAYFVSNRFEVVSLDVRGQPLSPTAGQARVVWSYDMWDQLGVFPCDAANGSPLIDGDLLYVPTSNGVDRNTFRDPARERNRKIPAPQAPNLIVLDKRTGRLVATDGLQIADQILHGQWSSPSLGRVEEVDQAGQASFRNLIFFGAGDGRCYAFEALSSVPEKPVRLKTVWSCDCIPPEYKPAGKVDWVTQYCLGDKRVQGTLNKHDGALVGMSEIIGTPVFVDNRVYVAIGRDPAHGRGRGALHCIDATGQRRHHPAAARLWTYQGLDRTLSTASVARRPGLSLRRGRPAALPRRPDGQVLLGSRCEVRDLGLDLGGQRKGLHAHLERPLGAGDRQGAAAFWIESISAAGHGLAGGGQRHALRRFHRRLALGRPPAIAVRACTTTGEWASRHVMILLNGHPLDSSSSRSDADFTVT